MKIHTFIVEELGKRNPDRSFAVQQSRPLQFSLKAAHVVLTAHLVCHFMMPALILHSELRKQYWCLPLSLVTLIACG